MELRIGTRRRNIDGQSHGQYQRQSPDRHHMRLRSHTEPVEENDDDARGWRTVRNRRTRRRLTQSDTAAPPSTGYHRRAREHESAPATTTGSSTRPGEQVSSRSNNPRGGPNRNLNNNNRSLPPPPPARNDVRPVHSASSSQPARGAALQAHSRQASRALAPSSSLSRSGQSHFSSNDRNAPRSSPWATDPSASQDHTSTPTSSSQPCISATKVKRSRDDFEEQAFSENFLHRDAVSVLFYHTSSPHPKADDVWPNLRCADKVPARYHLLKGRLPGATTARRSEDLIHSSAARQNLASTGRCGHTEDKGRISPSYIWPALRLPTEIYEEIASYLCRDDIKTMRLVCQEFDRHVSQVLFKTVVVPFNTEIYGMLATENKDVTSRGSKHAQRDTKSLAWTNANGDDVYDGHALDVFRGFGRHIRKFGMSFEVNEAALANAPCKAVMETHESFWGVYEWPFEQYLRFEDVAGLECAADETPRMTLAFSELSNVQELALSMDSGLGWLHGPDRSIRDRILRRPPSIFGAENRNPDRQAQAQNELWDHVVASHREAQVDLYSTQLFRAGLGHIHSGLPVYQQQAQIPFMDTQLVCEATEFEVGGSRRSPTGADNEPWRQRITYMDELEPSLPGNCGILFTSNHFEDSDTQMNNPVMPAGLTRSQTEWLLETEWAQRAFLSSYILSTIDNATNFSTVHTLTISQLSDRFLPTLSRDDLWDSLPSLKNVTICVIAGWRNISKDAAGYVKTSNVKPSDGIDPFYNLLRTMIVPRKKITRLTIGWITGGEHAEGLHARNKLLLPAPILRGDRAMEQTETVLEQSLLQFPFVEKLELRNCWVSPPALLQFVHIHDGHSLKSLTLNSVSLTPMLRPGGGPINNPHNALAGHGGNGNAVGTLLAATQNLLNLFTGLPGAVQGLPQTQQQYQAFQLQIQTLQTQVAALQTQAGPHLQVNIGQIQLQLAALQSQAAAGNQQAQGASNHQQSQQQGFLGVPGHPYGQAQIQHLILAHLNTAIQVLQTQAPTNNMNAPLPALAPANVPVPAAPGSLQSTIHAKPQEGSWTHVLDIISPGTNLSHHGSEHSSADPSRRTSLNHISLKSVGYARLPYALVEHPDPPTRIGRPWHTRRHVALAPAMLSTKFPLLGEIYPEVDVSEAAILDEVWGLYNGWKDWREAEKAEFDGCAPGGTGRYTGDIGRLGEAQAGA